VKPDGKTPPADKGARERHRDVACRVGGGTSIRMDEPENISPRGLSAGMQLDAAASAGMQQAHPLAAGAGPRLIPATPVHHDDFQDTLQTGECVKRRTQEAGFVEYRDNDGDSGHRGHGAAHGSSCQGPRLHPLTSTTRQFRPSLPSPGIYSCKPRLPPTTP